MSVIPSNTVVMPFAFVYAADDKAYLVNLSGGKESVHLLPSLFVRCLHTRGRAVEYCLHNVLILNVLQKAVFHVVKDGLLARD